MKTIMNLLLAMVVSGVAFASSNTTTGPKKVTDCVVSYSIDATGIDDPMAASMLKDATLVLGFLGDMNRTEFNMGAMMSMTSSMNVKTKEGVMLMDMMGSKIAVPLEGDQLEEIIGDSNADVDIKYMDETKEIAGYKCKKAVVTDEEGNVATIYYTDDIVPANMMSQYMPGNLKGLPLEFSVDQNGVQMKFIATEVKTEKQDPADYSTEIPDGYQEMSFEDLQQMGGGF